MEEKAADGMAMRLFHGGHPAWDALYEARIKELHAKIGELTVERDFLQKSFGRRATVGGWK